MIVTNKILRIVLLSIGLCATALGILGIFLPLLPTVPLLLLAAACFARSSEHFHSWLLEHPQLGPMLNSFLDGQGIPLRAKITAISLIWISIPVSALFFLDQLWLKVFLIALGLCVTIYLLRLPLCEASED
jgi:uncharacterized membrane protein YbaN (DUF454 family)